MRQRSGNEVIPSPSGLGASLPEDTPKRASGGSVAREWPLPAGVVAAPGHVEDWLDQCGKAEAGGVGASVPFSGSNSWR
jgi:hypothetical protein